MLRVMHRLRMSGHDAHYAGDLVDGARCLGLFGDVATELLVRHDGDEGLFRAYDSVEFLAPVYHGDYVKATARLLAVGRTSRRRSYELHVTARTYEVGPLLTSGELLDPPILAARAVGITVTPLERQRLTPAALRRAS